MRTLPTERAFRVLLLCLLMVLSACQPRTEAEFFKKAEVYAEKGRFEKAVETYQKYLADFPEGERRDKALFRSGGILYYALGQRAPAVRNFDLLVRKYPASASAFRAREILAGVFRDEVQDYKRAAIEYRCLLEQQPESPKAPGYQFQIARCFFLDNLIEHAIIEFGKLIENYPDSDLTIRAYDELGSAYMILGQPDQAFFVFRKAVRQFPESPQRTALEFKMGNCLEEMYRYKDALQIYRSLLDRYENRPAVEIRIAGVKERQKNRLGEPEPVDYSYRPRSRAARVEEKVAEPSAGRNKAPGGPVQIEGLHFRAKKRKTDE